ncbi:hypothetical protein [Boudabousia marimammalium]|uniref:Uncharacterized protein n=1 Tax=Boudabousia marimammalium TaxID=156892 RepID=A0A1Q5PMF2_9ACTO|nr:hypothetical protein [Boudabousia marimammalium]OKL48724.1 hypothetical protein BM477_05890 [Boudabousia marimammalium]
MSKMPAFAIFGPTLGWLVLMSVSFTGWTVASLLVSGVLYIFSASALLVGRRRLSEGVKKSANQGTPTWFIAGVSGYFLLLLTFGMLIWAPSSQTWAVIIQVSLLLGTLVTSMGAWMSSSALLKNS